MHKMVKCDRSRTHLGGYANKGAEQFDRIPDEERKVVLIVMGDEDTLDDERRHPRS